MPLKKRAYLIHGWEGSPESGWLPWLKRELEARGFEVVVPTMPNTNYPQMEEWLTHLNEVVGSADEQCYFVGHSLGCITILRYLERLKSEDKIGGAVLVAGFTSNLGFPELSNFFPDQGDLNWLKIKSQGKKFVAIHSDNDAIVSTHYGERFFQENLGAHYILEHEMGHFSGGDSVFEVPIILKSVLEMTE